MKLNALCLLLVSILLTACEKNQSPSFLHIERVALEVTPDFEQGTNDHGISDAWVYLNDQLIGAYEVPATIPVIASGKQKITVIAGIKKNGIQSARINYPFYDQYNTELTLIPNDTIDFSEDQENTVVINDHYCPVVSYFSDGLIFWNERFEDPGVQFESTNPGNNDISITQDPSLVFNYNPDANSQGTGIIELTSSDPYFEIRSTHEFNPSSGREVYLEFNYLSTCTLQVGVYEMAPEVTKVLGKGVFPNSNWSKIYIELTGEIAERVNATSYSIFIEGLIDNDESEGTVLLDNIKLVYPE